MLSLTTQYDLEYVLNSYHEQRKAISSKEKFIKLKIV